MRLLSVVLVCAGCGSSPSDPADGSIDASGGGDSSTPLPDGPSADATMAAPTTIVGAIKSPCCLAVDATNVYYGSENGAAIWSVPIAGGAPTKLAEGFISTLAIAVDPKFAYAQIGTGAIAKITLPGGGWSLLFNGTGGSVGHGLFLEGSSLHWAVTSMGNILRISTSGGMPATIATGQASPVAVAGYGNQLYWANEGTGAIMGMTLPSGTPAMITTTTSPWHLAVDANNVYVHENTNKSTLSKAPRAGGALTKLFGPNMGLPMTQWVIWIAADEGGAVWVATSAGEIFKVDAATGKGSLVASDPHVPEVIADAKNLYWIAADMPFGTGSIKKSVKP